jgi:PAS domain S-box-containing protein
MSPNLAVGLPSAGREQIAASTALDRSVPSTVGDDTDWPDANDLGLEQLVRQRQGQALIQHTPLVAAGNLANSALLVLALALWQAAPFPLLLGWLALIWLGVGFQLSRWRKHRHRPKPTAVGAKLIHRSAIWALVLGGLWGAAGIVFFTPDSLVHQVLLVFVLGGMVTGAVTTLSAIPPASVAYTITSMSPLVVRLAAEGEAVSYVMSAMLLLYTTAMVFIIRLNYTGLVKGMKDRLEKDVAVAQLARLSDSLEQLVAERTEKLRQSNADLEREIEERKHAEQKSRESETRYRNLFESAPIPIREEDFSQVKAHIDTLGIHGREEFAAYLDQHPEFIMECADLMIQVDANRAALDLHRATEKAEFLATFGNKFSERALHGLRRAIEAIHGGETRLEFEATVGRDDGSKRDVIARWSVAAGHEETYSRVLFTSMDVTERNQAGQALRESDQRFKDFTEAATDWAWETDAQHRLTYFSQGRRQVEGVGSTNPLGQTRWESVGVDPETDDLWRKHKDTLDAHRAFRDFQFSFTDSDGGRHHRKISGKPVFDEEGGFLGYRGTATDITAAIEAEKRAADAQTIFMNAIESVSDGYALFDADDRLVICNSTWRDVINVAVADIIEPGVEFIDILRAHLDSGTVSDAIGREDEWLRERMEQHRHPTEAFEVRRVNDGWIRVYEERTPDGGTMTIATDITERHLAEQALSAAEQRLQVVVDNAPLLLFALDRDGVFTFSKGAGLKAIGFEPDEAVGQSFFETYKDRPDMCSRAARALNGESVFAYSRFRNMDLSVAYSPIFDMEGKVEGAVGVGIDISDRVKLEEQLRQAQKMEAVGQLTGGVAHDFNNLLTVIQGNLELLKSGLNDHTQQQNHVQAALQAASRGAELTWQLLAFSRQQPLAPKVTDCNSLIGGMIEMLTRTLGENIGIKTTLAPNLSQAMVDPAQLESAVLNLAINARDAMPGGGRLTIETANVILDDRHQTPNDGVVPGRYVAVAVTDDGIGMPADALEKAFEPFFTTKEFGKGSGLGLSMVYGFAKQSGGHARISSAVGEGTTVSLCLPEAQPSAVDGTDDTLHFNAVESGGERILVVEDDPGVRTLVVRLLSQAGYVVSEAADGPTAIKFLDELSRVDLLLSDVILAGGMSGPDLVKAVQAGKPDMKVLFMSGHPENTALLTGMLDKDIDLIRKPFRHNELVHTVRQVLDA